MAAFIGIMIFYLGFIFFIWWRVVSERKNPLRKSVSHGKVHAGLDPPLKDREQISTRARTFQVGTIVFAAFAILSAVVCIAQGIVPLLGIEACIWAGLAIFWHLRQIKGSVANYAALSIAFAVLLFNIITVTNRMDEKDKEIDEYAARRCASASPDYFA